MVAGERLVVVELELDEQCAEEHVRPVPGLQQHRVAPLPAETRALCELALQHGPRVHVRACSLEAASGLRLDPVQERELPLLHDFVVITPARVPCNDSAVPGRALITARRVAHRRHDCAAELRPPPLRVEARLHRVLACEVRHLAVAPVRDPGAVCSRVIAGT